MYLIFLIIFILFYLFLFEWNKSHLTFKALSYLKLFNNILINT